MTELEQNLFAKLISDNLSLQADVKLLKLCLVDHLERYHKSIGGEFKTDVFEKGYLQQHRQAYEQLFVDYPIISDALAHIVRKNLGL